MQGNVEKLGFLQFTVSLCSYSASSLLYCREQRNMSSSNGEISLFTNFSQIDRGYLL